MACDHYSEDSIMSRIPLATLKQRCQKRQASRCISPWWILPTNLHLFLTSMVVGHVFPKSATSETYSSGDETCGIDVSEKGVTKNSIEGCPEKSAKMRPQLHSSSASASCFPHSSPCASVDGREKRTLVVFRSLQAQHSQPRRENIVR